MNKVIRILSAAFMIFFSLSPVFADNNIGRNVYSVYTENFNGVKIEYRDWTGQIDRPQVVDSADLDRGAFWPNKYGNASIVVDELLYEEGEERIDGNKFWRANININAASSSVWMPVNFVNPLYNGTEERNMNAYIGGTLEFWIRSSSPQADHVRVGIVAEWGNKVAMTYQLFTPNGEWQKIVIPLSNLYSINRVSAPFILLADASYFTLSFPINLVIDIDNIVWKKASGAGSFNITIKNISDNEAAQEITWDQSVFGLGWRAANQYVELDLDSLPDDNWGVQIYTDNTSNEASPQYTGDMTPDITSGLVSEEDPSKMLPMCWRVTDKVLPYSGTGDPVAKDYDKTLNMRIGYDPEEDAYGLYDSGSNDPGASTYFPWFFMKDKAMFTYADPDIYNGADYLKVWDKKGFHAAAGEVNYWGMSPGAMYDFMIKPRIYFGADFSTSAPFATYQTNTITIELFYE